MSIDLKAMAKHAADLLQQHQREQEGCYTCQQIVHDCTRQVAEACLDAARDELWGLGYQSFNEHFKKLKREICGEKEAGNDQG
jgi:hypothetical protein